MGLPSPAGVSLNPWSCRGTSWSFPNVERIPSLIPLQDRLSRCCVRALALCPARSRGCHASGASWVNCFIGAKSLAQCRGSPLPTLTGKVEPSVIIRIFQNVQRDQVSPCPDTGGAGTNHRSPERRPIVPGRPVNRDGQHLGFCVPAEAWGRSANFSLCPRGDVGRADTEGRTVSHDTSRWH